MESEKFLNASNYCPDSALVIRSEESNTIADSDCSKSNVTSVQQSSQDGKKLDASNFDTETARADLTHANSEVSDDNESAIKNISVQSTEVETLMPSVYDSDNLDQEENAGGRVASVAAMKARTEMSAANDTEDEIKTIDEDDAEPVEIPEEEEISENESEMARSADDDDGDNYDDEEDHSQEAVDGEEDEVQEVSGSDVSPIEDEDDNEGIDEYDSNDDDDDPRDREVESDDDDVAVISDTTEDDEDNKEQEQEEDSRYDRKRVCEQLYDSEEESEISDRDDDDLMDDIVVSRRTDKRDVKQPARKKEIDNKFKKSKVAKRSRIADWRLKLKNRSMKWLKLASMRHVPESHGDVSMLGYIASSVNTTPNKDYQISENSPFVISQVTSITSVDSSTDASKALPQTEEEQLSSLDMQQINKIQDYIKRPSQEEECQDVKQQTCRQQLHISSRDENNKENIGNNETNESAYAKVNGIPTEDLAIDKISTANKDVLNVDESDDMDIMEISDEPSGEPSNEASSSETINATVINNVSKNSYENELSKDNTCVINLPPIMTTGSESSEKEEKISEGHSKYEPNDEKEIEIKVESLGQPEQSQSSKSLSPHLRVANENDNNAPASMDITTSKSSIHQSLDASAAIESTGKRSRPSTGDEKIETEDVHPAKKLKSQLDTYFSTHDEILNEYIERTSNNSVDEIQKHLGQLIVEIQTLNDMIKAKENEWNNLLHLKKVKEEICLRLTRKKQVMDVMSTKVDQVNDLDGDASLMTSQSENLVSDNNKKILSSAIYAATGNFVANTTVTSIVSTPIAPSKSVSAIATSSTPNNTSLDISSNNNPLNNLSNISAISVTGLQSQINTNLSNTSAANSIVQNILQNRANMKSSDLVKEKATTQRLHRILVSRNILPKPTTITSAMGLAANGDLLPNTGPNPLSKVTATTATTLLHTAVNSSLPTLSFSGVNTPVNLITSNSSGHKSICNEQQPILNNYLTASATATIQKQLGEMLNGHHNFRNSLESGNVTNGAHTLGFGRQGAFKDVKSIIADYRQKHPEIVPRRGRRVKSSGLANLNQADASNILGNVLKSDSRSAVDVSALLAKMDGNSRPSSNDSSHSATNPTGNNIIGGNMSFKDVLIQFAKMNEQNSADRSSSAANMKAATSGHSATSASFPEVTLHPVAMQSSLDQGAGSLLHGILTKFNRPNISSATPLLPSSTTISTNYNNTFSPTLARLLTAPERITPAANTLHPSLQQSAGGTNTNALNISKMVSGHNSEITITPVVSTQPIPTLLQQQLEHQQISLKRERIKLENLLNAKEDDADDSIDRLVIDEGGDSSIGAEDNIRIAPNAFGLEFNENEVPACQGCKKNEAQFVCAGCANQLYCSRECQVAAWDEHSEVCTG